MSDILKELRDRFLYDPITGNLISFRYGNRVIKGQEHGGYLRVTHKNKNYRIHRVAWALYYGSFPEGHLDHLNGDRKDNRINNLRIVTNRENNLNKSSHRKGRLPGTFKTPSGSWVSQIGIKGATKYLGTFKTEAEAHAAYLKKLTELELSR